MLELRVRSTVVDDSGEFVVVVHVPTTQAKLARASTHMRQQLAQKVGEMAATEVEERLGNDATGD